MSSPLQLLHLCSFIKDTHIQRHIPVSFSVQGCPNRELPVMSFFEMDTAPSVIGNMMLPAPPNYCCSTGSGCVQ